MDWLRRKNVLFADTTNETLGATELSPSRVGIHFSDRGNSGTWSRGTHNRCNLGCFVITLDFMHPDLVILHEQGCFFECTFPCQNKGCLFKIVTSESCSGLQKGTDVSPIQARTDDTILPRCQCRFLQRGESQTSKRGGLILIDQYVCASCRH